MSKKHVEAKGRRSTGRSSIYRGLNCVSAPQRSCFRSRRRRRGMRATRQRRTIANEHKCKCVSPINVVCDTTKEHIVANEHKSLHANEHKCKCVHSKKGDAPRAIYVPALHVPAAAPITFSVQPLHFISVRVSSCDNAKQKRRYLRASQSLSVSYDRSENDEVHAFRRPRVRFRRCLCNLVVA